MSRILDEPSALLLAAVRELHENRHLLPIIVALGRGPMTPRALSQRLGYRNGLGSRLKRLCDLGLVVKTARDRYVLIGVSPAVIARAVRILKRDAPTYEMPGVFPYAVEPATAAPRLPKLPEGEPVPESVSPSTLVVSPQAQKVGDRFKVPTVRTEGEAAMGPVHVCAICGERPTPLRYGATPVCYSCARKQ